MDYLQPDETELEQVRRHTLSAVDGFLGITLLWAAALVAAIILSGTDGLGQYAANIWTAFGLVTVAAIWLAVLLHWRRATSLYTVTGERVYFAYGRIRFHLLQTTYDKVTDLHIHQSLFGRIWGYGTVRVQTAGTGLSLAGVVDPVTFKQRIEDARSKFLRSLIQSSTASVRSVGKSPEAGPATVSWSGTPSPHSLLGGMLAAGLAVTIGLVLLGVALFIAPEAFIGAGITITVGLAIAWGQWIAYRYTSYQVSDRGVVVQKGWLSRRRIEATFAKVTDVAVEQGIVPRLLGYGKITINTAGSNEAPVVFHGIAEPDAVKAVIDDVRGE